MDPADNVPHADSISASLPPVSTLATNIPATCSPTAHHMENQHYEQYHSGNVPGPSFSSSHFSAQTGYQGFIGRSPYTEDAGTDVVDRTAYNQSSPIVTSVDGRNVVHTRPQSSEGMTLAAGASYSSPIGTISEQYYVSNEQNSHSTHSSPLQNAEPNVLNVQHVEVNQQTMNIDSQGGHIEDKAPDMNIEPVSQNINVGQDPSNQHAGPLLEHEQEVSDESGWACDVIMETKHELRAEKNASLSVTLEEARLGLLKVIMYLEAHPVIAGSYVSTLWQLFKLIEQYKTESVENYVVLPGLDIVKQEDNISNLHERLKHMLASEKDMDSYDVNDAYRLMVRQDKGNSSAESRKGARRRKSKRVSAIRNRPMTYAEDDFQEFVVKDDVEDEDDDDGAFSHDPPEFDKSLDNKSDEELDEASVGLFSTELATVVRMPKKRGRRPRHKHGHTCLICNKHFKNQSHLREHAITHTDDKPFKCETCGKGFRRQSYVKQHQMLHTGEKPHGCDQCDKGFRSTSELRQHKSVHSGKRPFKCTECEAQFVYSAGLKSHMRIHTGDRPFTCTMCGIKLAHAGSLKVHMMRAHTREKPFVCSTCGKAFTTGADLRTHQKIHTGERPYLCTECDKRFSQCGQLKTHMRTHTGEKPYLCTECGKGFAHTSSLSVHMRGHTGERPYHCTLCDKKCTDSTNLKKHMRLHTGEKKAHLCTICGHTFTQSSSLHKHMLQQHAPDAGERCATATDHTDTDIQGHHPAQGSEHQPGIVSVHAPVHMQGNMPIHVPPPHPQMLQYAEHMVPILDYMGASQHLYAQHLSGH